MKKKSLTGMLLLAAGWAGAQSPVLTGLCTFPAALNESSGLARLDNNRVLTHNDSGDSARLFIYNHTSCTVEKQVFIRDYTARDIEAVTVDDSGYVYLADMGNNTGNRADLCILKMPKADLLSMDTVDAEQIRFSYADQLSFGAANHNFDAEAFFHHHDSLYLFSKNHGVPGNYCKRYALPDVQGTYTPAPLDSFAFPTWVTDAAVDPAHAFFVLLSEQKLYVFEMAGGVAGFGHLRATLGWPFLSQKEGICFQGNDSILVSDEYSFGTGGKLYLADLSPWVNVPEGQGREAQRFPVYRHNGMLYIQNTGATGMKVRVTDLMGRIIQSETVPGGGSFVFGPSFHGLIHLEQEGYMQLVRF